MEDSNMKVLTQGDIDKLPNNYIRQSSWSILNQVANDEVSQEIDKRNIFRKLIEIPRKLPVIGRLFNRIDYTKYGYRSDYLNRY